MGKSTCSPNRLDEIREQQPELGFALYAMDPGGAVTFEVYTPDGEVFTFTGATADEALALAFPVEDTPAPASSETIFD